MKKGNYSIAKRSIFCFRSASILYIAGCHCTNHPWDNRSSCNRYNNPLNSNGLNR